MLALSRGDDSLIVSPLHGGSIVGWTRRGAHMLRHPSPDAVLLGRPGAMGCFPLVPFCNRIAWRQFTWDGRTYEVAANFGDHPHAIHGIGWQRPWRVEAVADDSVTLVLHHDAAGESARAWPFAFEARLTYTLTAQCLTIRTEATNRHPAPAPMGVGAHPWFPRTKDAMLTFEAGGVWINQDSLPAMHAPISPDWDHVKGRAVDDEKLDNCFTGWRGRARLPHLRIEADAVLSNLQVYTPAGADFFCVEPVSHVPDAINLTGLPKAQGMRVLTEGETLGGAMTFMPTDGH